MAQRQRTRTGRRTTAQQARHTPDAIPSAALMTVPEAAQYMRICRIRLYDLIRSEYFPRGVIVRIGKSIRIVRTALDAFLADGGRGLSGGSRRPAA